MRSFNDLFMQGLEEKLIPSITYNEILMVPQYSDIQSRSDCDVSTRITRNIGMKIPIVTSPMDTVTETDMAIGMAREGGMGVIHRFFLYSSKKLNLVYIFFWNHKILNRF